MEGRKKEEFGAGDLAHLNLAMRAFPQVAEAAKVLKLVSEKTGFPVENREALLKAIGGHEVPFGGQHVPAETAVDLLPNYYFPIESAEDFLSKMADFRKRIEHPYGEGLTVRLRAAEAPAPEGLEAPRVTDEQLFRLSGFEPSKGPGSGGLSSRKG